MQMVTVTVWVRTVSLTSHLTQTLVLTRTQTLVLDLDLDLGRVLDLSSHLISKQIASLLVVYSVMVCVPLLVNYQYKIVRVDVSTLVTLMTQTLYHLLLLLIVDKCRIIHIQV